MPMRKLVLILLATVLILPAAARAGSDSSGDGSLVVSSADGKLAVQGKGLIFGHFDHGTLTIVGDYKPDDNTALSSVSGARMKVVGSNVVYSGSDVRFLFPSGKYNLIVEGSGIAVSAVGNGKITAVAAFTGDDGSFTVDGNHAQLIGTAASVSSSYGKGNSGSTPAAPVAAASARMASAMAAATPTILVVEDESSIASFVSLYLKNAGYVVKTAPNGTEALALAASEDPALIVLDLMLPDIDGIEVCKRIRQDSDVPILMLTARDEDVDKIIGLEVGADDYLTKPFNPRELVARIRSILRRAAPERRERESETIQHGDLHVDAGRREVHVGDQEIQLAPKEFDLLWELLDHRGLVLTRDQLLERVWGYTFAGDTRTVDVHVRQLRRKLEDASPIVTVWGVGYKVAPAPRAAEERGFRLIRRFVHT